ncbi:hypothetical protein ACFX13_039490 [Malus domestica]
MEMEMGAGWWTIWICYDAVTIGAMDNSGKLGDWVHEQRQCADGFLSNGRWIERFGFSQMWRRVLVWWVHASWVQQEGLR